MDVTGHAVRVPASSVHCIPCLHVRSWTLRRTDEPAPSISETLRLPAAAMSIALEPS